MNISFSQPQEDVPKPETRSFLRKFLSPPTFGDLNKNRIANIQHKILLGLFFLAGVSILLVLSDSDSPRFLINIILIAFTFSIILLANFLLYRGHLQPVSWLFIIIFSFAAVNGIPSARGLSLSLMVEIALIFTIAGLLLRPWEVIGVTTAFIILVIIVAWSTSQAGIIFLTSLLSILGLLLATASSTLKQSFSQADQSNKNLRDANQNLQELAMTLEQRVARRTQELEYQALQLQAAVDISRIAGNELETNQLIQKSVNLVKDRFKLYYVGIFLLDETRRFILLQAGTDEAGRKLLERQRKLVVAPGSTLGECILQRQAQVANSVTSQENTSILAGARSELGLPLISQGQIIGAINIHSEREAAFNPEFINILQTLADQLANSIEKARLYTQISQRAVELNQARAIADAAKEEAESARATAEEANRSLAMQVWQTTGQALLNEKMRGEQNIHTLGHNIIQQLCKYINAESGAIYILQDQTLQLAGVYAYKRKWLIQECQLGDGLIGQAVSENETIIHRLPENYIALGLRHHKLLPKFRMVIPITYNEQVYGAIVLDALTEFTPPQKQFIESVIENIAIAFLTAQTRMRIDELLAQTHQQTRELLPTQEEELEALAL